MKIGNSLLHIFDKLVCQCSRQVVPKLFCRLKLLYRGNNVFVLTIDHMICKRGRHSTVHRGLPFDLALRTFFKLLFQLAATICLVHSLSFHQCRFVHTTSTQTQLATREQTSGSFKELVDTKNTTERQRQKHYYKYN